MVELMTNLTFKQLLERLMMTQAEAAKELGVSKFSISRWANNTVTMRAAQRRTVLRQFGRRLRSLGIDVKSIEWPARRPLYRYSYKVHNPNAQPVVAHVAGQTTTIPANGDRTIKYEAAGAYSIEPELSDGDLPLLIRAWRGDLVLATPSPALPKKETDDGAELGEHGGDNLGADAIEQKQGGAEGQKHPESESAHDSQVETVTK